MAQTPGRPALGEGKSLKITVLVEQETLTALDLVMQEMRRTMPGVRIDRSTAVRYLLSQALTPYVRTNDAPATLGEDQTADHASSNEDQSLPKAAPSQDQQRTTGRKRTREAVAKG